MVLGRSAASDGRDYLDLVALSQNSDGVLVFGNELEVNRHRKRGLEAGGLKGLRQVGMIWQQMGCLIDADLHA
jgi:hypothetical protein